MGRKPERVIFVADFDKTLYFRDDPTVFAQNLQAVEKLRTAGHAFVLATGRSTASMDRVLPDWRSRIDYALLDNGATCVETKSGNVLWQEVFEDHEITSLNESLREFFEEFSPTKEFGNVYYYGETESATPLEQISRLRVWVRDAETVRALDEHLAEVFEGEFVVNRDENALPSGIDWVDGEMRAFVDISPPRADKDIAIERLRDEVFGVREIVAVGDNWRDVTMIRKFDGFVMANGDKLLVKSVRKSHRVASVAELVDRVLEGRIKIRHSSKQKDNLIMAAIVGGCFILMIALIGLAWWIAEMTPSGYGQSDDGSSVSEEDDDWEEEDKVTTLTAAAQELCGGGEADVLYEGVATKQDSGIFVCRDSGIIFEVDWRTILFDGVADISAMYLGKAQDELVNRYFSGAYYIYRPSGQAAQDALYLLVEADSEQDAIWKTYEGIYGFLTSDERSDYYLDVAVFYSEDLGDIQSVQDYLVLATMTREWRGSLEPLTIDRKKVQVTTSDLMALQELAGTPSAYSAQTRSAIKDHRHFRSTMSSAGTLSKDAEYVKLVMENVDWTTE